MLLTRRFFLKSSGAMAAYMGFAPWTALARATPARVTPHKILVVLFLRGGADGLNLVIPYGDPGYTTLRRSIAIPTPASGRDTAALDLDGFFSLHPGLRAVHPHFGRGSAVAIHAVGYDKNTRSHFEEQDTWETGVIGNTMNSDGWLNRHLATSQGHGSIRAVSIGDNLPRILHGKFPAYAIRGLEDLALPNRRIDPAALTAALEHAYSDRAPSPAPRGGGVGASPTEGAAASNQMRQRAQDLLSQTAHTTLEGMEQLKSVAAQPYVPAAPYPETELGNRFREAARLIKADIGVEVVEIDYGGWDTHNEQGQEGQGQYGNLVQTMGDALAAFAADLESRLDDVLVVTMTDFGRTAAENGTRGTDHGWANCMLLLGGPVLAKSSALGGTAVPAVAPDRRGPVLGPWPGLAPDQLYEARDLKHTTDFRDVLSELVTNHLGNPNLAAILPSHTFKPVGLI